MIKKWLRVDDDGKLSHVFEYENGQKVQIPINKGRLNKVAARQSKRT